MFFFCFIFFTEKTKQMSSRYTRLADGSGPSSATIPLLSLALFAALLAVLVLGIVGPLTFNVRQKTLCGDTEIYVDELCYDVIIVGGGTAGVAAARRITDSAQMSVLVLEGGPDYGKWDPVVLEITNFFGYFANIVNYPYKYYYQYIGKPESSGSSHVFAGGRTLGGGATENYMVAFRASDQYWDNMDTYLGSPGIYDANSMHQRYQSFEYLDDNGYYASQPTRGNGQGPYQKFKIEALPTSGTIAGTDEEAMANLCAAGLGLTQYTDQSFNNPGYTYGTYPHIEILWDFNTTNPQIRSTSRGAFLGPTVMDQETYAGVFGRPLQAILNATVLKLLSIGTKFVGAQYKGVDGYTRNAYARKEIIVSGGVNTPSILQRSGVGPAQCLENAGVPPVIVNENVGANLATHVGGQIVWFWSNITNVPSNFAGMPNLISNMWADPTTNGIPNERGYHMHLISLQPAIMLSGMLSLHTKSYGTSKISSPDPFMGPQIFGNLLNNPNDLLTMRTAFRYVIYGLTGQPNPPFPLNIDFPTLADDALLDAWLIQFTGSLNHYTGMARMGPNATTSVADNRFRVWGATNLRVCDTQSFPFMPDSHPSLSATVIGDTCGEVVLEDHGFLSAKKKKKSVVIPKKPVQTPRKQIPKQTPTHSFPKKGDAELWAMYQAGLAAVRAKFQGKQLETLEMSIILQPEYQRLKAIYEPSKK